LPKKPLILIIDDDENWLNVLQDTVSSNFLAEIETFSDFLMAEKRIEKKPIDFDLLITDVFPAEYPHKNYRQNKGLEFADFLNDILKVRVIVVTGNTESVTDSLTDHKVSAAFDKGNWDKIKFINAVTKILKDLGYEYVRKTNNENKGSNAEGPAKIENENRPGENDANLTRPSNPPPSPYIT